MRNCLAAAQEVTQAPHAGKSGGWGAALQAQRSRAEQQPEATRRWGRRPVSWRLRPSPCATAAAGRRRTCRLLQSVWGLQDPDPALILWGGRSAPRMGLHKQPQPAAGHHPPQDRGVAPYVPSEPAGRRADRASVRPARHQVMRAVRVRLAVKLARRALERQPTGAHRSAPGQPLLKYIVGRVRAAGKPVQHGRAW